MFQTVAQNQSLTQYLETLNKTKHYFKDNSNSAESIDSLPNHSNLKSPQLYINTYVHLKFNIRHCERDQEEDGKKCHIAKIFALHVKYVYIIGFEHASRFIGSCQTFQISSECRLNIVMKKGGLREKERREKEIVREYLGYKPVKLPHWSNHP